MDYHYHARLTIHRREELAVAVLTRRLSLQAASAEFKLNRQSAAKWVRRYRLEGVAGLRDRSCRPHSSPRQMPTATVAKVESLRRQRWTGVRIALELGIGAATVSRVLRRLKVSRVRQLEPPLPPSRYTCSARRPATPRYQAPGAHPAALAPRHRRPQGWGQGHRGRVPPYRHRRP